MHPAPGTHDSRRLPDPQAEAIETAETISREVFRDAMAKIGTAVHIITTDGPAGRAGFTASAVCSVTDTPPTMLVCLNRSASVYDIFRTSQMLCINTLSMGQSRISNVFGGNSSSEQRFAEGSWRRGRTGMPLLMEAVATFECRIVQTHAVGTHDVLFCEVQELALTSGATGLIYCNRSYHHVTAVPPAPLTD